MSQFDVTNQISSANATVASIVEAAFEDLESVANGYRESSDFLRRAQSLTDEDIRHIDSLVDGFQDAVRNYIIDQVRGPVAQGTGEITVGVRSLILAARALTEGSNENAEYVRGIVEVFKDALGNGGDSEHGRAFWTSQILAPESAPVQTQCPRLEEIVYAVFWASSTSGKIYGIDTASPGHLATHRTGMTWFGSTAKDEAFTAATQVLAQHAGERINVKLIEVPVAINISGNAIDEMLNLNRESLLSSTAPLLDLDSYQR